MSGMDRKIEKRPWYRKKIWPTLILLAAAAATVYGVVLYPSGSTMKVDRDRLTIAPVRMENFSEFITVNGSVQPLTSVYLDAIEGGMVEARFVEEGQEVQAGDTLLRLVNTALLLGILQQETQLFEQVNNLRNTKLAMEEKRLSLEERLLQIEHDMRELQRNHRQAKDLLAGQVIAQEEYDQIRNSLELLERRRDLAIRAYEQDSIFRGRQVRQLEQSLSRMESTMDLVRGRLDDLVIRAPVDGTLSALDAEIGANKTQGQRLGQIDQQGAYKIRAAIDEHYIRRVETGQTGVFTLGGEEFSARVIKLYPDVNNNQFEVDMAFEGAPPADLRRGQSLRIKLELGATQPALVIPRGGFFMAGGGNWVFVVDPSGEIAQRRDVSLGRQNGDFHEVLGGLEATEQVVISSYESFRDVDRLVIR